MSDQALTNRLRQRSRRAGLAVAITMALTILLCVGVSAWIYGKTEPYVTDYVGVSADEAPTARPQPTEVADTNSNSSDATEVPAESTTASGNPAATQPAIQSVGTQPTDFQATHNSADVRVNLRPGPSVDSGDPVATLDPFTPLEYLGDQATDENGSVWLNMRTSDGIEGWIREIDTTAIS